MISKIAEALGELVSKDFTHTPSWAALAEGGLRIGNGIQSVNNINISAPQTQYLSPNKVFKKEEKPVNTTIGGKIRKIMKHKKQAFEQIEKTIKWNEVRGKHS